MTVIDTKDHNRQEQIAQYTYRYKYDD